MNSDWEDLPEPLSEVRNILIHFREERLDLPEIKDFDQKYRPNIVETVTMGNEVSSVDDLEYVVTFIKTQNDVINELIEAIRSRIDPGKIRLKSGEILDQDKLNKKMEECIDILRQLKTDVSQTDQIGNDLIQCIKEETEDIESRKKESETDESKTDEPKPLVRILNEDSDIEPEVEEMIKTIVPREEALERIRALEHDQGSEQ